MRLYKHACAQKRRQVSHFRAQVHLVTGTKRPTKHSGFAAVSKYVCSSLDA